MCTGFEGPEGPSREETGSSTGTQEIRVVPTPRKDETVRLQGGLVKPPPSGVAASFGSLTPLIRRTGGPELSLSR